MSYSWCCNNIQSQPGKKGEEEEGKKKKSVSLVCVLSCGVCIPSCHVFIKLHETGTDGWMQRFRCWGFCSCCTLLQSAHENCKNNCSKQTLWRKIKLSSALSVVMVLNLFFSHSPFRLQIAEDGGILAFTILFEGKVAEFGVCKKFHNPRTTQHRFC